MQIRQAEGPWANISLSSKAYVTPRTFCLLDAFCSQVQDFVRNLHTHKNQSRFNLLGCMSTLSQFGGCMSTLSQFGLTSWLPAIAVYWGWEEEMSQGCKQTPSIGSYFMPPRFRGTLRLACVHKWWLHVILLIVWQPYCCRYSHTRHGSHLCKATTCLKRPLMVFFLLNGWPCMKIPPV